MQKKTYNLTIDILRVLAILAVVFIHTTTRTLEATSFDLIHFPFTLFLNQVFRFAVPLFFLISGFVLELNFPFHLNFFRYLQRRLNRILIPYIFWSFIYYFFVYTKHNIDFFTSLALGSASYQLYFIPTLLIFYLIFPLIHRFYYLISNKWVLFILGIIQLALLFYDYNIHPLTFYRPFNIALLNFYVFLLGIIISHHQAKLITTVTKYKNYLFAISIILAIFIFFQGRNNYLQTHNYLTFYSQWRISVLFYTISLASFLYYFLNKKTFNLSIVKILSRLSFFVFFIHIIVLESVWYFIGKMLFSQIHTNPINQLWFDPLFFISVTTISFSIAFIIHKIPYLKKISG